MGDSTDTDTDTDNYNYIGSTSANSGKFTDCCTDLHHYYGVHGSKFLLHHYIYRSTSTINVLFKALLWWTKLHTDIYKYHTDDKILDSGYIVESEK